MDNNQINNHGTARPPDGTLHTQIDNQPFIVEVFFNHNATETFQDKLLRVILAEEVRATC